MQKKVILLMCSGAETVQETVDYLVEKGEKVGLIKSSPLPTFFY